MFCFYSQEIDIYQEYFTIKNVDDKVCRSTIGRGIGLLRLNPTECTTQAIYHEMFHILGFLHEHQRKDRNNYINVKMINVPHKHDREFKILRCRRDTMDMPYDGKSIMHYRADQISDTIISKVNQNTLLMQ